MTPILLLLAAALLGAQPAAGAAPPPPLSTIVITANGARSEAVTGEESAVACARFRLEPGAVAAFFRAARRVEPRDFHHDLDMSRCHAAGNAMLRNGEAVSWFIDAVGRGSLTFAGGTAAYYHRPDPEEHTHAE